MARPLDTDVLVIGGGLTGLSCATFLAYHGVRCVLVERHPDVLSHPRQRSVAPRTMELYRQVGLDGRIRAARVDFADSAEYVMVRARTLASRRYLPVDKNDDAGPAAALSPCRGTPIDQNVLESLLRERAVELGAQIRFGTGMRAFVDRGDAVQARLCERDGTGYQLSARYLVAADGGQSPVRRRLAVPMDGPEELFTLLTLMVDVDLRPALAGRIVHQAFLELPRPRTFLMALDQAGQRWVFGTTDEPESGEPDEARCVELVRAAAGLPDAPVRLRPQIPGTPRTVLRFPVGASVATTYRRGNVFLAGDAAHLMPPTGGFGGACGVQDAHNLAWKLAAVLRGRAGEGLLDTYEDERRPVARFTVDQALLRSRMRFLSTGPDDKAGPPARGDIVDRAAVLMGYRYHSAAVVGAGEPAEPYPVPDRCGAPGTRAPHTPLTADDPAGQSTIDLYGSGFVLLTGPDGTDWAAAAGTLPVPVLIRSFGVDLATGEAAAAYGIGPSGAVLVRPDGIVAWRDPGASTHPAAELRRVLAAVLANRQA